MKTLDDLKQELNYHTFLESQEVIDFYNKEKFAKLRKVTLKTFLFLREQPYFRTIIKKDGTSISTSYSFNADSNSMGHGLFKEDSNYVYVPLNNKYHSYDTNISFKPEDCCFSKENANIMIRSNGELNNLLGFKIKKSDIKHDLIIKDIINFPLLGIFSDKLPMFTSGKLKNL